MKRSGQKSLILLFMMGLLFLLVLGACSSGGSGGATSDKPEATESTERTNANSEEQAEEPEPVEVKQFSNEPVTLKVATQWGEENFQNNFVQDMKELVPHITFEYVDWNGTAEGIQEINSAGTVVDLLTPNLGVDVLLDLDMVQPLDEMVKEYGIDLSTVDPSFIALIRSQDPEGRLIGLTGNGGIYGLFYNKEVFDLFGVPYPTDNMTWDEIIDLAKKTTGTRDGNQYVGLEFGSDTVDAALLQLSTTLTDPDTGELLLSKDPKFTKYMELMKKIYSIPGIYNPEEPDKFMQKTAAMEINWHGFLTWFGGVTPEERAEFKKDMDILPVPSWSDIPQTAPAVHTAPTVINPYSENKEAALQVLQAIISIENQTKATRKGTIPAASDVEIRKQFGADNPDHQGKNVMAMFQHQFALPPARASVWDKYVDLNGAMPKFATSDMNIPEFIRVLEEESTIKIKNAQNKE